MSEGRLRQKAAGRERLGDGERSIVCMHFKRDSGQRLSRTPNKQRSMAKGGAKGLGAGHATYSSHEKKCVYFIHKIF